MSTIVHPYLGAEAARRELERPLVELGAEVPGRERRASSSSPGAVSPGAVSPRGYGVAQGTVSSVRRVPS
jgi:hypothetical protein